MHDPYAKLTTTTQLEIIRELPASCERVWEYLTNPELRKQWFCAGEMGTQPGESFVMDFDHTRLSDSTPQDSECGKPTVMRGTLTVYEPPNKLSYRWPGENAAEESLVTIELTSHGENTRLHLIHSKLSNPEFRKGASAGWHAHLDLLLDLAGGQEARDFWLHYNELKAAYDQRIDAAS